MLTLFVFSIFAQGSISERTHLAEPQALTVSDWKSWVKSQGVELSGIGEFSGALGPYSGGFFERLDSLASAQGRRLQIRHRSLFIGSGNKGIISQGSAICRGEVDSVVVGNQLAENRGFLRVGLQAAWHPRLHPILVQAGTFQFRSSEAKPLLSRASAWQPVEEDFVAQLELEAAKPPRVLKGFDSFEGIIRLVVPDQLLWLELGGIRDGVISDHIVGKTKIKRLATQVTSKRVSMEVEIKPGPSEYGIESYQESILTGLASLVGPGNVRKIADGQQILESGEGKIRVRYDWLFPPGVPLSSELDKYRFVLRIGDNYKEIEANLKFGPLELP